MSRGLTKKQIKKDEFLEAATDAGEWLETNWKMVLAWAGGLAVVAILMAGWYFMGKARDEAAQQILAQGMQVLATGDYEQAIDLFGQAEDKGGSRATEAVAELYRGIALSRNGQDDEAVPILKEVGASSVLLVAQTARAVLAGIHETAGEYEQAEAIYMTLSTEEDGLYPPARALLNAARTRRAMGREAEARELLESIVQDYPQSAAAAEVSRLLQP